MDLPIVSLFDRATLSGLLSSYDTLVAAVVSAVSTLILIALLAPGRWRRRAQPSETSAIDDLACDFIIDGASLKPANDAGRALLETLKKGGSRLAALSHHLDSACPGVQKDIEGLVLYGNAFRHNCTRADGAGLEIIGQPRGAAALLSIRPASEDARALRDSEASLAFARGEAHFLRDVLDRAPILAWNVGADAELTWANATYRERFEAPSALLPDHRIPNAFEQVLEDVPLTPRGSGSRRRVAISGPQAAEAQWFELTQFDAASGETLAFAQSADDLVAAEGALKRFIETLTETFAHLPIGLAVFDKNRRLGLFNPALTTLVKIDAVWLAGRPSLRDFLERLRETRQMPEQKDFAAWRRKLTELEEGARDGTYEENWVLPSGNIFRVTGRPHPQGALAFLFEDISTSIILERKYRSELELSQATLDRMAEAVAVFDTSGSLVFVNSAFATLWKFDPMERLDGPGVVEMTRIWAERCAPNPVWAQITEFATAAGTRTSSTAAVETHDGRTLHVLIAPLPDASALVVFRDLTAESNALTAAQGELIARAAAREADVALDDLALEQIHLPVETAVRQLLSAIPAAQTPIAFQALSNAAQGLKDGLVRSRELHDIARHGAESRSESSPWPGLTAALAARGLALAAPADAGTWAPDLRRAALALSLAVADLVAPSARIRLEVTQSEGAYRLAVAGAAKDPVPGDAMSLALARRVVEASGGSLSLATQDGVVTALAELPVAEKTAPDDASEETALRA